MDFICFSINAWEKRKARKQQFMLYLSRRSDVGRVLYIEPSLNIWRLVFMPAAELSSKESRGRWHRALSFKAERITDKLLVLTPIFFIPFAFRFQLIYKINLYFLYLRIRTLARREGIKSEVIWLYHPFDGQLLKWFKDRRLACFSGAEEWAEYFIEYSKASRAKRREMEEAIISLDDLVFVVSKALLGPAKALNKNSYHIYDGTSPELFAKEHAQAPPELINIKHPIVGYIGTVSSRIDIELVKALSERMPQFSFVFVGDIHSERIDIGPLKGIGNIFFLRGKPYDELPRYAAFFDVSLLPYKALLFTSPPTKVFDYLASGKPIVSTALPELGFLKGFIYEAKNADEFEAGIKKALEEDTPEAVIRRREKAMENSWERRVEEIMSLIKNRL